MIIPTPPSNRNEQIAPGVFQCKKCGRLQHSAMVECPVCREERRAKIRVFLDQQFAGGRPFYLAAAVIVLALLVFMVLF